MCVGLLVNAHGLTHRSLTVLRCTIRLILSLCAAGATLNTLRPCSYAAASEDAVDDENPF